MLLRVGVYAMRGTDALYGGTACALPGENIDIPAVLLRKFTYLKNPRYKDPKVPFWPFPPPFSVPARVSPLPFSVLTEPRARSISARSWTRFPSRKRRPRRSCLREVPCPLSCATACPVLPTPYKMSGTP
eukprot:875428-Rhodomonas_salina.1